MGFQLRMDDSESDFPSVGFDFTHVHLFRDHSHGRRQRARTSLNQRTGRHTHTHTAHVRFVARCLGHLEDERIRRPSASQVVALAI